MTTAGAEEEQHAGRASRPRGVETVMGAGAAMAEPGQALRARLMAGDQGSPAICVQTIERRHGRDAPGHPASASLGGLYHLSRPACSCLPAASGVIAPLITCAETFHNSFSRFGVPRDRIW